MKKSQYIKQRRIQQRNLERVMCKNMIWHIIIITIIMIIALCNMTKVIAEKEDTSKSISESYSNKTTVPYVYNLTTFEPQTEEELAAQKENAEKLERFRQDIETLRKCSEEGISCEYGICDECPITTGFQLRFKC